MNTPRFDLAAQIDRLGADSLLPPKPDKKPIDQPAAGCVSARVGDVENDQDTTHRSKLHRCGFDHGDGAPEAERHL